MTGTFKNIVTGAFAGSANGFFGAGGGLFLVPLFIKWLKMDEKKAFATSVAVVFPMSAISLIVYFFKGNIQFMSVLPVLCGGFAGGVLSGRVFGSIPTTLLRRTFGLLIIYGGVRALLLL